MTSGMLIVAAVICMALAASLSIHCFTTGKFFLGTVNVAVVVANIVIIVANIGRRLAS
jgi:hypothetical protein